MEQEIKPLVCKLGGTIFPGKDYTKEFSDAANYIIKQQEAGYKPIAVVSAPKGITNMLIGLWETNNEAVCKSVDTLRKKCEEMSKGFPNLYDRLDDEIKELEELLAHRKERDRTLLIGENLSGICLSYTLNKLGCGSDYKSGYDVGVTVTSLGIPVEEESISNIRKNLNGFLNPESKTIPVIGGFGGRCLETGEYKVMERNSTDVTAALCAVGTNAEKIKILKETPGIFRVEPWFGDYGIVSNLSYGEAGELGRRGVESVHTMAIDIAEKYKIPIEVTNLTEDSSTIISDKTSTTKDKFVAAISCRPVYLVTIVDPSMETSGYLQAASEILSRRKISILDIFCSWRTLSFTINDKKAEKETSIEKIMEEELKQKGYAHARVRGRHVHIISMIGDALKGRTGALEHVSRIFGQNGINIECYQGSDETMSPNMVFGIRSEDVSKGIKILCKELFS
jgi:aspartate kinase